jgi:hypothetical protein
VRPRARSRAVVVAVAIDARASVDPPREVGRARAIDARAVARAIAIDRPIDPSIARRARSPKVKKSRRARLFAHTTTDRARTKSRADISAPRRHGIARRARERARASERTNARASERTNERGRKVAIERARDRRARGGRGERARAGTRTRSRDIAQSRRAVEVNRARARR